MAPEQEAQLNKEVVIGHKAAAAYSGYMKDYFDRQRKLLFDQFVVANDIDVSLTIRSAMDALSAVERSIQSDIDSGRMAELTLEAQK